MGIEFFIVLVVFIVFYLTIKVISDHLLRRKIIKAGHIDKAGILERKVVNEETDRYPSLKWGLVAFMTGLGFILIKVLDIINPKFFDYGDATLAIGILLVFISLGFLIYFFIMNMRKNKP